MKDYEEFFEFAEEILIHPKFHELKRYTHHKGITLFDHSISVAYRAFRVAKKLRLDKRAVVRGALLHDFYLYDWHVEGKKERKPLFKKHGFTHAKTAYDNARQYFTLTKKEKDIIVKHMFPLNWRPPRYLESWIVNFTDDFTSLSEAVFRNRNQKKSIQEYVEDQLKKSS
ncbi:MAG: HD domain-containing protein [Candidatus Izemoplasmataceae bacterium]